MSSEATEFAKKIEKRYNHVEAPILTEVESILGTERTKDLKKYLLEKRKAQIKGIPSRDSMSSAVEPFFEDFEKNESVAELQEICSKTSVNYQTISQELFKYIKAFIEIASQDNEGKDTLVDKKHLDETLIKLSKDKEIPFLEPLGAEMTDINSQSPELVLRAKVMAKVINDELAQPFRGHVSQTTLAEKVDNLCQYILVKKQGYENEESVKKNVELLDSIVDEFTTNRVLLNDKNLTKEKLKELDTIIGFTERTSSEAKQLEAEGRKTQVKINAVEQAKASLKDLLVNGQKVNFDELPEDVKENLTAISAPAATLDTANETFNTEQITALENALIVLAKDIRNNSGDVESTNYQLSTEDKKRISDVFKEYKKAFPKFGAKLKTQRFKDAVEQKEWIDWLLNSNFTDLADHSSKSMVANIERLISSENNPFSDKFVELFNALKDVKTADEIPTLVEAGTLSFSKTASSFKSLQDAISNYKCQTNPDPSDVIINIGSLIDEINESKTGIKDKQLIQKLQQAIAKNMNITVDLNKLIKSEKLTIDSLNKLTTDVANACINPALKNLPEQITELPKEYDLENYVKEELPELRKQKDTKDTRQELSDLIISIWKDAKIKPTNYEKLKYEYGGAFATQKEMLTYIDELLKRNKSLEPEQISEEAIESKKTAKNIKTISPEDIANATDIKVTNLEVTWLDKRDNTSKIHAFKTKRALENFIAKTLPPKGKVVTSRSKRK